MDHLSPIKAIDRNCPDSKFVYCEEQMNSLDPDGLPPFKLYLKKNSVIMLLRNIDPAIGLCNGTILKVLTFTQKVLQAVFVTGSQAGTAVFIPRICFIADATSPIRFRRFQFPVNLASTVMINKAQGQVLKLIG